MVPAAKRGTGSAKVQRPGDGDRGTSHQVPASGRFKNGPRDFRDTKIGRFDFSSLRNRSFQNLRSAEVGWSKWLRDAVTSWISMNLISNLICSSRGLSSCYRTSRTSSLVQILQRSVNFNISELAAFLSWTIAKGERINKKMNEKFVAILLRYREHLKFDEQQSSFAIQSLVKTQSARLALEVSRWASWRRSSNGIRKIRPSPRVPRPRPAPSFGPAASSTAPSGPSCPSRRCRTCCNCRKDNKPARWADGLAGNIFCAADFCLYTISKKDIKC